MGLNNYHPDHPDYKFFEQAATEIYEWLPNDKRMKFDMELISEGFSDIEDLNVRERFFRLLHFLEVNYVKPVNWANNILESPIFTRRVEGNLPRFWIELENEVRIDELAKQLEVTEAFHSVLKDLKIDFEYKRYLENLKGEPRNE